MYQSEKQQVEGGVVSFCHFHHPYLRMCASYPQNLGSVLLEVLSQN